MEGSRTALAGVVLIMALIAIALSLLTLLSPSPAVLAPHHHVVHSAALGDPQRSVS